MLFHTFSSQEERRSFGGSAFIEMQFCKLPLGTKKKRIVKDVDYWKLDSLYIDEEETFYLNYRQIFSDGLYSNLKTGPVDIFGINYYAPERLDSIMEMIRDKKPLDYEVLADWLNKAREFNGFYILGI